MGEAGIFREDDRVELIEGEVITMSPIGSRHAASVTKLGQVLQRALLSKPLIVRIQNPIRLSEYSEPQPDLALVRAREDFYASGHPTGADVLFLVEVAESSLMYDRLTKLSLYARSGIAEVWLVDLVNHLVEVHSAPAANGYSTVQRFRPGTVVVSTVLPAIEIAADQILA